MLDSNLSDKDDVRDMDVMENGEGESINTEGEKSMKVEKDELSGANDELATTTAGTATMTRMPLHPYCALFPVASETVLAALTEDIRKDGLREPITTHQKMILDGQNREICCLNAGVKPTYAEYVGDTSDKGLWQFVLSKNIRRRQLSDSQAGVIAAKMTRKRDNNVSNPQICGFIQKQAAEMMCVSDSMVRDAVRLLRTGTPELIAEVERGTIKIYEALEKCKALLEDNTEDAKIESVATDQNVKETQGSTPDSNDASTDTPMTDGEHDNEVKSDDQTETVIAEKSGDNLSIDQAINNAMQEALDQVGVSPTKSSPDAFLELAEQSIITSDDDGTPDSDISIDMGENKEPDQSVENSNEQPQSYLERFTDGTVSFKQILKQRPNDLPQEEGEMVYREFRKFMDWTRKDYEDVRDRYDPRSKR